MILLPILQFFPADGRGAIFDFFDGRVRFLFHYNGSTQREREGSDALSDDTGNVSNCN